MIGKRLVLDGKRLTIDDVFFLTKHREEVALAPQAFRVVTRAHRFLLRESARSVIYGVNTGFGPMASRLIHPSKLAELQVNLIRSHAVGMGDPIPERYVLSAMVVRLNTLIKGYSGVSPALVEAFKVFVNKRIIPVVPEHGAVGTSGDLVQLAHIALALIGEGEVCFQGKRRRTRDVLRSLRIQPYALQPKEGLALINGTAVMTGIGAHLCRETLRFLEIAVRCGALAFELISGFPDCFSSELHALRPHPGQRRVARALRTLLLSSRLLRDRTHLRLTETGQSVTRVPREVQEVYSFRCVPQILGPLYDTLVNTGRVLEVEMNAVTDNPIVDMKHRVFLHGGNFHGDYVAVALDQLKISLVKLILLSERRTNFFLHPKMNNGLPPFLNVHEPGLSLALQGLQFVATSTAAQSQSLAFPHNVHSIPTNGDNQDVVSMGTDAALIAAKVVENAYIVLAIELITLAQAVDAHRVRGKLSREGRRLYTALRRVFPLIEEDRDLTSDLPRVVALLKEGRIFNSSFFSI